MAGSLSGRNRRLSKMKKDIAVIIGLFLLIVILLIFGQSINTISFVNPRSNQVTDIKNQKKSTTVIINSLEVNALIAKTPTERKKGLSIKDLLPLNEGMLFVFSDSAQYGFWMKDMKFAIDIIWIDESKKIVDIATNVTTQPGKKDKQLTIYRPKSAAIYVLEVNSGLSELHNLRIGDSVNFEI